MTIRRLWPQSLVGQVILLVALALFVAQAINFGLLLRERNRLTLTGQTAPLAYRVVTALDQRDRAPDRVASRRDRPEWLRPRNVAFLSTPPTLGGKPRPRRSPIAS